MYFHAFLVGVSLCVSLSFSLFYSPPIEAGDLSITDYTLVSKKRASRTDYEYTYTATITNSGDAYNGVTASVVSSSPNTTIIDGSVSFGDVSARTSLVSSDTFVIQQNRQYPFDPGSLTWSFAWNDASEYDQFGWEVPALNPDTIINSPTWGDIYSDQVSVRVPEEVARSDVENIAVSVEGQINGYISDISTYWIKLDNPRTAEEMSYLMRELRSNPLVQAASPEIAYSLDTVLPEENDINSLDENKRWGFSKINYSQAWELLHRYNVDLSDNITVGVIDSYFDTSHPDLSDQFIFDLNGVQTIVPEILDPNSCSGNVGHGTNVSGIIAASLNGEGMNGIAPTAHIYPMSNFVCLGGVLRPSYEVTAAKILEAVKAGVNVINNSWGELLSGDPENGTTCLEEALNTPYYAALQQAFSAGIVVVAAAGNENENSECHFPSAFPGVIAVGALDENDNRHEESNYSSDREYLWVAAPGKNIYTTSPTYSGSLYTSGFGKTSAATPFVSGLAALLLQIDTGLKSDDVARIIRNTGDDIEVSDDNGNKFFWKRINVLRAVEEASGINGIISLNDTGFVTCGNNTSYSLSCPQTGFPGQDAEYGRDVTNNDDSDGHAGFSFTKLDFYGNPLPADATSWSCIKDNVTNLVWEAKTESGLHYKTNTYSWFEPDADINMGNEGVQDAGNCVVDIGDNPIACDTNSYIRKIRTTGLCGRHDWRLPDREELHSIRDYSVSWPGPAIDTQYFPYTETEYWTYNTLATDLNKAWTYGYSIQNGGISRDKGTPQRVRLVSGKETLYPSRTSVCWYYDPEERFEVIDYDTVIDRFTGLMWSSVIPGTHEWEDALNLVPLVNNGDYENHGYSDWRLPNIKELTSIMDLGCGGTYLNPAVFTGVEYRSYWSSTSTAGQTNVAWYVDYSTGSFSPFGRKVQINYSYPNSFGVLVVR